MPARFAVLDESQSDEMLAAGDRQRAGGCGERRLPELPTRSPSSASTRRAMRSSPALDAALRCKAFLRAIRAARGRRSAIFARRSASRRARTSRRSSARCSKDGLAPARMARARGRAAAPARRPTRSAPRPCRGLPTQTDRDGAARASTSRSSSPRRRRRASRRPSSPRRSPAMKPRRLLARAEPRLSRFIDKLQGRARRRTHEALFTLAAGDPRRRRAAQGAARRARFPGSHRQDAGAALARRRRLGALQARPRHRPRADRRGAGHEPGAMGDPAPDHRGFHRRRRRARRARAHALRGRRSQAVDLRLPGRGAAAIRDEPAELEAEGRARRRCTSRTCA